MEEYSKTITIRRKRLIQTKILFVICYLLIYQSAWEPNWASGQASMGSRAAYCQSTSKFWNIHFKVFFIFCFLTSDYVLQCVFLTNETLTKRVWARVLVCRPPAIWKNPFPINKNTSSITPLVISNIHSNTTSKQVQAYYFISTAVALVAVYSVVLPPSLMVFLDALVSLGSMLESDSVIN